MKYIESYMEITHEGNNRHNIELNFPGIKPN